MPGQMALTFFCFSPERIAHENLSKHIMEYKKTNEMCSVCTLIVKYFDDELEKNETQMQIGTMFAKACQLLPEALENPVSTLTIMGDQKSGIFYGTGVLAGRRQERNYSCQFPIFLSNMGSILCMCVSYVYYTIGIKQIFISCN